MLVPDAQDVWIVIAAYNEGTVIQDVVTSLRKDYPHVVVVDDGSADSTGRVAAAAGATVVTHPINLGQGAALQTAIAFALMRDARFIVTFDADGQHRAEDVARLLAALTGHGAEFALGSRFLGEAPSMPPTRRLLLKAAAVFTRLTTGLAVTDAHNGLRAMTRRGAQALHLRQNRMAHASEILDQIAASRLKYVEAPVTITYTEYSLSKGQTLGDAINILIDLFARRLHR
jgi:glycosyltransferase involved in cell wall biosynthesis